MYNSGFELLGLFDVFTQTRPNLIQIFEFLPKSVWNLKISYPSPKKIRTGFELLELSLPKLYPYVIFFLSKMLTTYNKLITLH